TGLLGKNQTARFHTRSGLLTACIKDGWIELNFPSLPVQPAHIPVLANILGVNPLFSGSSQIHYLLEVESEDIVRNLKPDFTALSQLPVRGIMVTSISKGDVDFVSRFFAPSVGNNEDPVTGSAHCVLGPYWQQKLGKSSFTAYQASARGGIIKVTMLNDRVLLAGQAITVMKCVFLQGACS
ncbi:MAG: yddE, partial [Massilibacillus sp.]|nr:yddE [Massilibacillus sp.]